MRHPGARSPRSRPRFRTRYPRTRGDICFIIPNASRPRPPSPSRSRGLPPRPAPDRAGHRHRPDPRRLRDHRAGARHCTSIRCSSGSTARSSGRWAAVGQGLRHRGRHRHREDARHPADRRGDPPGAAPGRRGEPRAGGDARDADLERRHRHDRHRAALVPGRPDHRAATPSSWTRSTRPRPSWSSAWRSASGPAAGSSGSAPRWIRPSTPATSTAPRCWRPRRSIPRSGPGCRWCRKHADEFLDERFIRHVHQGARGVAVFVPTRARSGAAGRGARARSGRGSPRRSTTAASRSGSSGRSSRARSSSPSCSP